MARCGGQQPRGEEQAAWPAKRPGSSSELVWQIGSRSDTQARQVLAQMMGSWEWSATWALSSSIVGAGFRR